MTTDLAFFFAGGAFPAGQKGKSQTDRMGRGHGRIGPPLYPPLVGRRIPLFASFPAQPAWTPPGPTRSNVERNLSRRASVGVVTAVVVSGRRRRRIP